MNTLRTLCPGETAVVRGLTATGTMARRLQDLGLVENTVVKCVGQSPLGDPRAFWIRGAVIALRKTDCDTVLV